MAAVLPEDHAHSGHDIQSWLKYAGYGIAAGTFIFGMINGLWKIDARLEHIVVHLEQRDKAHDSLAKAHDSLAQSVKQMAERAVSPDAARDMIKMAVLELVAANPGRLASPYAPMQPKVAKVRTIPIKPAQ
jgi:hypothetical protein